MIKEVLSDKQIRRKMVVGVTDYIQGIYLTLDMDNFDKNEWVDVIKASATLPGAFPPVHLRDMHLIDGGVIWNINLIGAIEACKDLGVKDEKNIIIDVFMLNPKFVKNLNEK